MSSSISWCLLSLFIINAETQTRRCNRHAFLFSWCQCARVLITAYSEAKLHISVDSVKDSSHFVPLADEVIDEVTFKIWIEWINFYICIMLFLVLPRRIVIEPLLPRMDSWARFLRSNAGYCVHARYCEDCHYGKPKYSFRKQTPTCSVLLRLW